MGWKTITSCKETLRLMSEAMEQPLPWPTRILSRIHLLMCRNCRYSQSQFQGLKKLVARYASYEEEHPRSYTATLSQEAMDRMKSLLRKERLI